MGGIDGVDREYRDWLKSLSKPVSDGTVDLRAPFSEEAALKAAFNELAEGDSELAG